MLWKKRVDPCLPEVPKRVLYDAGCPSLFSRQGIIKEDHARMASVSDTSKGVFQFLHFSFCQSSRLQDRNSGVTTSIGIGVGYKVSGSQRVARTLSWQLITIVCDELMANSYEFVQSHLYIFVWSDYASFIGVRDGPSCLRFLKIASYEFIRNHYLMK